MPKLKPSPMEEKRGAIRDYISGGMARYSIGYEELAAVAGISSRTLYNRMEKPETFTIEELMRIFKKLNISLKIYRKDEDLV